MLSRLGLRAETRRAALNTLAAVAPGWMREHADPEWFEGYSRCTENYWLPKGKEARMEDLATVGADVACSFWQRQMLLTRHKA
jgi:transposase